MCTTWIVTKKGLWYLADVCRQRVDYPALKASVARLAEDWGARRVLVEDAGTGTALVQELRGIVTGIIPVTPQTDKVSRMAVASSKFESGEVFLPEQLPGSRTSKRSYSHSPGADTMTSAISISQALLETTRSWITAVSPEAWSKVLGPGKICPDRWRYRLDL